MDAEYFSIEGAAEKLGCTASQIQFYLDEGLIRYAWDSHADNSPPFDIVDMMDLPDSWRPGEPVDPSSIKPLKGKFLYLPSFHLNRNKTDKIKQFQLSGDFLENFKGQLVVVVYDITDELGLDSRQIAYPTITINVSNPIITNEELIRFSEAFSEEAEEELEDEVEEVEEILPYRLPPKIKQEKSRAIVHFANSFYKEFGKEPTTNPLVNYMLEKNDPIYPCQIHERDEKKITSIAINEEVVAVRQIREALIRLKPKDSK